MENHLSNNLNRLMAQANLSASELGRRINLPAATIKKIRTGENSNPTVASLSPIASYFNLSVSQLLGEEQTSFVNSHLTMLNAIESNSIPIISWTAAINWQDSKGHVTATLLSERHYSKSAYALCIESHEWQQFKKGSYLVIDPQIHAEQGDIIVVHHISQSRATLKLLLIEDGVYYLKSLNIPDHIICMETISKEYELLGVVAEYRAYRKNI